MRTLPIMAFHHSSLRCAALLGGALHVLPQGGSDESLAEAMRARWYGKSFFEIAPIPEEAAFEPWPECIEPKLRGRHWERHNNRPFYATAPRKRGKK